MTTWRNMTAAERKQFKYEKRRTRRAFERTARNSTKGRFGFTDNEKFRASMRQQRLNRLRARKRIVPKATVPHVENHNSAREQDRRLRQIARGQLKRENGLVDMGRQA